MTHNRLTNAYVVLAIGLPNIDYGFSHNAPEIMSAIPKVKRQLAV